jgi:hypothetical protein
MFSVRLILLLFVLPALADAREKDVSHWAFQQPRHVVPPQVRNPARPRSAVDGFILARLEKDGVAPAPEADRETLLRRLHFTLIGLPPTPEERAAFLSDDRPDAYERLVDRLLGSPQFGERWASHWLDVVRFAETNGYEGDSLRPHAWRYRDYVTRAFNKDIPYSVFLTEQLAGDLLAETEQDAGRRQELLIAAGLHRCGPQHLVSGNLDADTLRQEFLTEITDAAGAVFLGLTMGCARCHDHKFDPLSQKDYYQLEAFFASAHPREVDIASSPDRENHARVVKDLNDRSAPVRKAIADLEAPYRARILEQKKAKLEPAYRDALAIEQRNRTPQQQRLATDAQTLLKITWDEVLAVLSVKDAARRIELRKQLHDLQSQMPLPPAQAWTLGPGKSTPMHVLKRGDVKRRGEAVQPGYPGILLRVCSEPAKENLDRIALARWLTRPDHPLTARVIVNRLWQHHFGRGLVATPGDFGTRGTAPSHPELLDWLAGELIRSGWSLKHIHRLLVTSSAFRQDSRCNNPKAAERDPDNLLLWRMNRQRLDAEVLRDSMLAVSGQLTRRLGGPPVRVPLEPEVYDLIFTEDEPDGLWHETRDILEHSRRSLYLLRKRNVRLPLLEAFDQPDTLTPCPRRGTSTFAPQALILMNGPFAREQSRALAARLRREGQRTSEQLVRRAFVLALGREPNAAESKTALGFLDAQEKLAGKEALADLCLALLNRNEFLYVR